MLDPQFPRVISASLRSSFNQCQKRFFYETLCGLQRKDSQSIHLTAGAAYAAALEATRKTWAISANFDDSVAAGLEALIRSYGTYVPAEGEKKTFDRTVAAYVEYLVSYPLASDPIKPSRDSSGKPRVEFTFTFEIPGCFHPITKDPLLYSGAPDELAEYNGALFVLDDKTTSSIGSQWSKQWELRSQFTGYVCGLKEAYQLPIMGAVIRGMAILKEKCTTQQAIVYRHPWMIERWKERLIWDTKRMLESWSAHYFPHTGEESNACTHYGLCQFHELCVTDPHYEKNFLDTAFEVNRWDPVARERQK